jgi:ABC-2 type transport system ATP-binding protein
MQNKAIEIHDVRKTYRRKVRALGGVAMSIRPGEIFGLLGPNGAGKSTLVKILMTVVRPDRAEGSLLGAPLGTKSVLARVGYLPEHHRFPKYLTARQALQYYGALAKVPRAVRNTRAEQLLENVGLGQWKDARVGTFSKGMQQRLGLAQALINDPDLIVLDEPTDGLDPMGRREVRRLLQSIGGQGKTVFINSHLLSEVEMVCSRVAILNQGEVVRQGTIDELTAEGDTYRVAVLDDQNGPIDTRITRALGPELVAGLNAKAARGVASLQAEQPRDIQPAIDALRRAGLVITGIEKCRQSLEDLFVEVVSAPNGGQSSVPRGAQIPSTTAPTPPPAPGGQGGDR